MTFPDLVEPYQWNYRPQHPRRPDWFKEWPGVERHNHAKVSLVVLRLYKDAFVR